MTIGEKIKALREEKGMTQKKLCSTFMTRNMLSRIENGFALPSLTTLEHIAKALEIDAGYFLSSEDDPSYFQKIAVAQKLRKHSQNGEHEECLRIADGFSLPDGELSMYFYSSCIALVRKNIKKADFSSALELCTRAKQYAISLPEPSTFEDICNHYEEYCTKALEGKGMEPSFPDSSALLSSLHEKYLYDFLTKLIRQGKSELAAQIFDQLKISSPLYRKHINARLSMASSNHERARTLLSEILEQTDTKQDISFCYTVYSDLEKSCKALGDYEGAYNSSISKNELASKYDLRAFTEM